MAAKDPDTVNLQVDALYLFKSVPPTGPFGSIAPAGIITQLTLTNQFPLAEAFSSKGTYDSYYRPTHPGNGTKGAYGFPAVRAPHPGVCVCGWHRCVRRSANAHTSGINTQ
jgi:hypothetical protein